MEKSLTDASKHLIDTGRKSYVPNYQPRELILDHAEGSRVWDLDNNEYIDLGTGISVNSLGHQDEDLLQALIDQARKLWHTSNIYFTQPAIELAEDLVRTTFADRVFFSNSGAEANEAAIKMARKYSSLQHPASKREIITFFGSFHGRTLTTVTATAQPKYQEGFEPLPGGFSYCAFNDETAIEKMISDDTCAIMVEPIQGEGGVRPADPGFLRKLRELCNRHQALLILDEVQTGIGRTGKLFAYLWEKGFEPDILTTAKALGGGVPIGATLANEEVAQALHLGSHGSTFGGNPICAAVARAVLKKVNTPGVEANVASMGELLRQRLQQIGEPLGLFKDIRGLGLMVGAELSAELAGKASEITEAARLHGVLILQAGPDVLRFLPPLTISEDDLNEGLDRLQAALTEYVASQR